MKLYYQWIPWAYSSISAKIASEKLDKNSEIIWYPDFASVWSSIWENSLWVLPVENSYAGSIHENLYGFIKFGHKIIWEINLPVNHCLVSKEENLEDIKEVYSHPQALSQTYNYCKEKEINQIQFWNTASAAKMISEKNKPWAWAVSSKLAAEIYGLNILDEWIQDTDWNTTRFFVVAPQEFDWNFDKKANKTSIIFEWWHHPSVLYKCLWAFATNNINLTKIESLPSFKGGFTYLFWLDFEWKLEDENVKKAMEELEFFTEKITILWEY